jgi:hypothetical protein
MSFREKTAWIAVITTLVVWGYYFFVVWSGVEARALDGQGLLFLFLWCKGITLLLMIGLNLLVTRRRLKDFGAAPDELERKVEASANRIAKPLTEWSVMGIAVAALLWGQDVAAGFTDDPLGMLLIILANGLLFAVVFSNWLAELIIALRLRMLA